MLGRWTLALVMGAMCFACDGGGSDDAGARDSGDRQDSGGGGTDSGTPRDSGTPTDSATPDDAGGGCGSLTLPPLTTEDVAPGFSWSDPVALAQPAGSTDLYIVDQGGEIRIVRDGSVLPTAFLDLRARVDFEDFGGRNSERGLLGLAFHPDYASNGRFFVYYTATEGGRLRNILAEYHHTSGDTADTGEVARLIDIRDPESNHNGGQIAFGPDGFLYVAIGDGGGGGDVHGTRGNGQNLDVLLGKILRLDVENAAGDYAVDGNPFGPGTEPAGLPQIWAYGLRNPWRFSFDRMTGDLWIGDVGQGDWEEVDFQPASSTGGENYGWAAYEGTHEFRTSILPLATPHHPPVLEYNHSGGGGSVIGGQAIIGGYVYRGAAIPELRGWYFFGDYVGSPVAVMRLCDGAPAGVQRVSSLSGATGSLLSFGQDNEGELYMLGDEVVRIVSP